MKSKNKKTSVIFVCTGNTCRSPMAEFLFKDYLKQKGRLSDFAVSSAGLAVERGSVISENACGALNILGVKYNAGRKAKTFTVQMSLDADLIVAMSDLHAERCGSDNAVSFEELTGRPIGDPYGGSVNDYLECAVRMRDAFDKILELADKKTEQAPGYNT